jgi:cyanate lyase
MLLQWNKMVDLSLLQSVSYIAGVLGVCVAAIYYVLTARNQNKARQVWMFMNIYDKLSSKEFPIRIDLEDSG